MPIREVLIPCKPGLDSLGAAYLLTEGGRRGTIVFSPDVNAGAVLKNKGNAPRKITDCLEAFNLVGKPAAWESLADYCHRADRVQMGPRESRTGSLKWAIMRLRAALPGRDDLLWEAFRFVVGEKVDFRGGCDVRLWYHPVHGRLFQDFLSGDVPDWRKWVRVVRVGGLAVAVNESDHNITNLVMDAMPEVDLFIFRNPVHDWAGYVVRSAERRPDVDLAKVRARLPAGERWALHPSGNVLICGGPKAPQNTTTVDVDGLLRALAVNR